MSHYTDWGQAGLAPAALPAFFDCVRARGATLISAHRGGPSPGFAENAVETMAHTLHQAPVLMEVDVRIAADGVLVLMHDDTLDRTTTGTGRVAETAAAAISALQLEDADGQVLASRPPTLAQALAGARGRAVLQLDVKRGTPFEAVISAVQAAQAEGRVIVIVYGVADAAGVHALAPEVMLSVSVDEPADLAALAAAGVDLSRVLAFIGTRAPNPALDAELAAAGVEAIFGTLGRPGARLDDSYTSEDYVALNRMGVEIIATDRPIFVAQAIDAADGPGQAWEPCLP